MRIRKMASALSDWIWSETTTNPIRSAFVALIFSTWFVVGFTLTYYGYDGGFLKNILVEAHGMLLDILVIGILILWLNRLGEKRLETRRYREEIDDFRGWDSDEAGYRIAGNIKRLNRNGITDIDLEGCHLAKVNLILANLRGANLRDANLSRAFLSGADLRGADLFRADLVSVKLIGAKLIIANLSGATLIGANLSDANLSGAFLRGVNLSPDDLRDYLRDANMSLDDLLSDANLSFDDLHDYLRGAKPSFANLSRAILSDANLSGAVLLAAKLSNEQLAQAESLVGATLPDGTTIMTEEDEEAFKKRYRQSSRAKENLKKEGF